MLDELDICLTQQDLESQDLSYDSGQLQYQDYSQDRIEWIPGILRPVPFADLFALASEISGPQMIKQPLFSGVRNPSLNVIYKIVVKLRQLMANIPKAQADKLIYQYYGEMIEGAVKNTVKREQTEFDILSKTQASVNNDQMNRKIVFGRNIYHKKSMSYRDDRRLKQKQVVARAFCNRAYGTAALEQEMAADKYKVKVYKVDYKPLLLSILIETARRTEQFLIIECEQKISCLSRQQVKQAMSILVHCRTNFEQSQSMTLFKMIKAVVGIASEPAYEQEVIRLYNIIHLKLGELSPEQRIPYNLYRYQKKKKIEFFYGIKEKIFRFYDQQDVNLRIHGQKEPKGFKIHQVWSKRYEQELISAYLRSSDFKAIQSYFRRSFPQHRNYFSANALRSRLHQILTLSLRKIELDIDDLAWGQKYKSFLLKAQQKKIILHNLDALTIHLMLVQYYRFESTDREELLANILQSIEKYIQQKEQQFSELFSLQKEVFLSILRKEHPSTRSQQQPYRLNSVLSKERTSVECFVSAQIEAGLVHPWLQPQYE